MTIKPSSIDTLAENITAILGASQVLIGITNNLVCVATGIASPKTASYKFYTLDESVAPIGEWSDEYPVIQADPIDTNMLRGRIKRLALALSPYTLRSDRGRQYLSINCKNPNYAPPELEFGEHYALQDLRKALQVVQVNLIGRSEGTMILDFHCFDTYRPTVAEMITELSMVYSDLTDGDYLRLCTDLETIAASVAEYKSYRDVD